MRPLLPVVLLVSLVVVLLCMGQPVWCKCGAWVPWSWDIVSMHNSQHLLDPYSLTHLLHGLVGCLATAGLLRFRAVAARVDEPKRFACVVLAEAAWEVLENTPMVIERYRAATISRDYFGDSVLNSMADVCACALGYAIARRLPTWASIALFFATELTLVAWIRDSLLLNILMLAWPLQAVRTWQSG
jgi:hypothetical protein